MAHYDVVFVFGKIGTYLLDHPRNTLKRNIPDKLATFFEESPIQRIITLAMDANDNYYCYWENREGGKHWAYSANLKDEYARFWSFLEGTDEKSKLGVTFGTPTGHYLVWDDSGHWSSSTQMGVLDHAEENLNKKRVRSAAFGVNDSNVVIFTDGSFQWNLLGHYPDLTQLLKKQDSGDVIFIAMNQYRRNEYFVVLANAEVHIRASAVVEKDVVRVLEAYPDLEVISSTLVRRETTVNTSVGLPKKARRKEFLNGIINGVASGSATALIAGTFAACTIM